MSNKTRAGELLDKRIIDIIHQTKSNADNERTNPKENSDFDKKIKILGRKISFERMNLTKETISIVMPKGFSAMREDVAKIKYPSEQRPETIFTNDTGTINLMFQYMDEKVDNGVIETFRNQIFGMMKRVNPGIKEQELGVIENPEVTIAYVEFSNPVMDGKLYNLMFYLAVNGRPLMGSFNCRTKDMKYWRRVAFQMVQSIRLLQTEE